MAHPELGSRLLDSVIAQVDGLGKVETQARLEGRNMTMVLAPEKRQVKKERPHGEVKPADSDDSLPADVSADTPVPEASTQDVATDT